VRRKSISKIPVTNGKHATCIHDMRTKRDRTLATPCWLIRLSLPSPLLDCWCFSFFCRQLLIADDVIESNRIAGMTIDFLLVTFDGPLRVMLAATTMTPVTARSMAPCNGACDDNSSSDCYFTLERTCVLVVAAMMTSRFLSDACGVCDDGDGICYSDMFSSDDERYMP